MHRGPTQEAKHAAAICRAAVLKATSLYNCVWGKKSVKSLLTNSHGSSMAISDCSRGPLELETSGLYWIDAWMDALRLSAPIDPWRFTSPDYFFNRSTYMMIFILELGLLWSHNELA